MFAPIASWLEAREATIRTGAHVRAIRYEHGAVRGFVLDDGSLVEADAYVAAIPAWELTPRRAPFAAGTRARGPS